MKQDIEFMRATLNAWTMQETLDEIVQAIKEKRQIQHCVVNVAKLVNMQKDEELKKSVTSCDLVNIDGQGVVWGARFLGLPVPERVAGIDLFYNLLATAEKKGLRPYFLGAKEEVLQTAVENFQKQFPKLEIAGFHHGYFWDYEEDLVKKVAKTKADMLFVAISSPKKENFINKWNDTLKIPFVMGVGGSFDVAAGKVQRAPEWMQRWGLEWFYRLIQEPSRMWKRYLVTNAQFAVFLFKTKFFQSNALKSTFLG